MTTTAPQQLTLEPYSPDSPPSDLVALYGQPSPDTPREGCRIIRVDGRMVGLLQLRADRQILPPGVFEVGIDIRDDADKGRGFGTQALQLAAAEAFDALGAHRVQLSTDVDNAVMQAVAKKLGFKYEGQLRGFLPNEAGGKSDVAMYGITLDDYRERHSPA